MPRKPSSPCRRPGCPRYAEKGGFCLEHKRAEWAHYDRHERNKEHAAMYQSKAWVKGRAWFLRQRPFCECEQCKASGIQRPANVVHHIIPHKGDWALFLDMENWLPMSKLCHDRLESNFHKTPGGRPLS